MIVVRHAVCALVLSIPMVAGSLGAELKASPANQETSGSKKSKANAAEQESTAQRSTATVQQIPTTSLKKEPNDNENNGANEGSEFWVMLNHRVKITDSLLALFTFFLVVVGATQVRWMRRTIRTMDDTAERQLRAYVWTIVVETSNIEASNFVVHISVKNTGQTPAHDVCCWTCLIHYDSPLPAGFEFQATPVEIPGPKYVVNPGSDHLAIASPDTPITDPDRAAIRAGNKGLYLWGEVRYKDAFDKSRYAKFRLVWGHDAVAPGVGMWQYCDEGNEAN